MKNNCTDTDDRPTIVEVRALLEITEQLAHCINKDEFKRIINVYYDASKRLFKES